MERLDREKAAEMEKMRLEMEHELKLRPLETSTAAGSDDGEEVIEGDAGEDGERPMRARAPRWEETLAGRTKRFGDTLRHVEKMTTKDAEDADGRRSNSTILRKYRASV